MRSPCLGYWPPMLTVTDEKWIVLWPFEWATNCFFAYHYNSFHMINLMIKEMCLSVCLCGVYRHTWDFSLIWRSPLPLKGYKCWSMLGVYGHWAVRVLKHGTHARHTYCDTDLLFLIDIFEVPWHTHTYCRAYGSGAVTTCFYDSCLSLSGIVPRYPACEANSPPVSHRSG